MPVTGPAEDQNSQARPDFTDAHAASPPAHSQPSPGFDQPFAAAQAPQYTAPSGLDLTSLPDGIATWHDQRGLQILWLLSSIFMVMLDIVGLDVGFLAGLLGIIGSSLAVCNCFQGMDLRSIVKVWIVCQTQVSGLQLWKQGSVYYAGCSHFGLCDFRHIRADWHSAAQRSKQLGV